MAACIKKRDFKRNCLFCSRSRLRSDLVSVTKNVNEREIWFSKLGRQFELKCRKSGDHMICLDHFPPLKSLKPRAKIAPYKDGSPHRVTCEDMEVSDSDNEESSNDSEEENYTLEDAEFGSVAITDEDSKFQNLLCSWNNLLPSISKCWSCLKNQVDTSATAEVTKKGLAVHVNLKCSKCDRTWNWCSSPCLDKPGKTGPKQEELNLQACVAVMTTGNGFKKIDAFCKVLEMPFLSERRYYELVNSSVRPAIDEVYQKQKDDVLSEIRRNCEEDDGVNLAGDGQYDSRGYSAVLCRFSILDIRTKLLLDFETTRKSRGGNSMVLEKLGHESSFPRVLSELRMLTGLQNPILSFTSDRCVNLTQSMKEYPTVQHFFDSWHWIRSIRKDLAEKSKQKQFEPLKSWIKPLITHIHTSIEMAKGNGQIAFQMIMSFFWHVQDKHSQFQDIGDIQFDQVQNCSHTTTSSNRKYLNMNNKADKKAFDVLMSIMVKGNRQRDLNSVSPYFATCAVESFHSLASSYVPKENFFDKAGYDMRSKLASIHWNQLQIDESKGLRKVEAKVSYFCKTKKSIVWRSRKTAPKNEWRFTILQMAKEKVASEYVQITDTEQSELDARAEAEREMYAQSNH